MVQTRIFRHERVDDIPLLMGLANTLHLAEVLDHHLATPRRQPGLHHGPLAVGWLADSRSQAAHRQSAVRDGAHGMPRTLAHLLGHPIREVECRDDRLGGVLARLRDDETWEARERALWAATVTVDARAAGEPPGPYHALGIPPRAHGWGQAAGAQHRPASRPATTEAAGRRRATRPPGR